VPFISWPQHLFVAPRFDNLNLGGVDMVRRWRSGGWFAMQEQPVSVLAASRNRQSTESGTADLEPLTAICWPMPSKRSIPPL
jgi:hypothetical protein